MHDHCSCHTADKKCQQVPNSDSEKKEMIIGILRVALAAVLVGISYIRFDRWWIEFVLCLGAYLILVYDVLFKAFKNIVHGEIFDENFLMLIATVGAMAIRQYHEGVLVLLFYHVGEMLEDYATAKSHRSIVGLIDDMPLAAHVVTDDGITEMKPEEVELGTVLEIRPGEKISIDGQVIMGTSTLNLASLTGESLPQEVQSGSKVFSGAVNNDGLIRIKTLKRFEDSTLSKIIGLIEEEESKKSKSESFITRFSKIYTPVVIALAFLIFLIPSIVAGFEGVKTVGYLYNALNILIISCPCSLVISVPLAFFAGMGRASRLGVLIKGSLALENMAKAQTFVFDKTGTLTTGDFALLTVTDEKTMKIAAALESKVSHPIARAVVKAYGDNPVMETESFENIKGEGVKGIIAGRTYYLGNRSLLSAHDIQVPVIESPFKVLCLGSTDDGFIGYLEIADTLKDSSEAALADLKRQKVNKTVMLSGDNSDICNKIGSELSVDEVYGDLLPQEKLEKLNSLKLAGRTAFVGDGMNDSPSILAADVGIAMGGLGSDAAIESADVVIMNDDLLKVAETKRLSRRVMWLIYENITAILLVKIGFLILAAFGRSNMIWAILADVGIMVVAVLNSLRILWPGLKFSRKK